MRLFNVLIECVLYPINLTHIQNYHISIFFEVIIDIYYINCWLYVVNILKIDYKLQIYI